MEKFIIVAGSPNSGKTITTNITINKLIDNGFTVADYFNDKSSKDFWTVMSKNGVQYGKGGSVVLEKNAKKVVIISYGDSLEWLKIVFDEINFNDYYAVICCSHATKGKDIFNFFHKIIGTIDLNKTQVIPIFKNLLSRHNNDNQENEYVANFIVSLL